MPLIGQTTVSIDENSIGTKSTGVALTTAHTASFTGQHVVRFKASSAACQLQVSEYDGAVTDTGLLEGGRLYAADGVYEIPQFQIAGHTYTYSMVFSSGAPSCDIFAVFELDQRGDT